MFLKEISVLKDIIYKLNLFINSTYLKNKEIMIYGINWKEFKANKQLDQFFEDLTEEISEEKEENI